MALRGAFTKTMELFFGRDNITFVITSNAPTAIKKSRTYGSFSSCFAAGCECPHMAGYFTSASRTLKSRKQGRAVANYVQDHYLLPVSEDWICLATRGLRIERCGAFSFQRR